ncbi:uncharacterized protein G2W53_031340 [Senna tora]|uniref:Uncharacterized protein n=1 Tax=Senna tora TaxID=362788 RepID=A0A834WFG4_9FABA|nr:uncharacterized protein G2W53_031340 [Senna tora]
MENCNRSSSHEKGEMMQMENYDLRCYSASIAERQQGPKDLKKGKSIFRFCTCKSWSFKGSEFQRKKRVATYKMYCVEGKAKGSLRRSFKWLKDKYSHVLYGSC